MASVIRVNTINSRSGLSTVTFDNSGAGVEVAGIVTATTFSGNFNGSVDSSALNATGISTFNNDVVTGAGATVGIGTTVFFGDNIQANFGDQSDLKIYHDSPTDQSVILSSKKISLMSGIGIEIEDESGKQLADFTKGGASRLFYNANGDATDLKFTTSGIGATIYNQLDTTNIVASGIITATTELNSPLVGVGTDDPQTDIQVRKVNAAQIRVTSDTDAAVVSVGREPGAGNVNNAFIRYGNTSNGYPYSSHNSLDIVNNDVGSVNFYLSANNAGAAIGDFYWHKGPNNARLMTLTKGGSLGVGVTLPTERLHVGGGATITGTSWFGANLNVQGNLSLVGNLVVPAGISADMVGNLTGNVLTRYAGNTALGIVTTNYLNVTGVTTITDSLRIGTAIDVGSKKFVAGSGGDQFMILGTGSVGIRTTIINDGIDLEVDGDGMFTQSVGIGTTAPRCAVDFADAVSVRGSNRNKIAYMLPPRISNAERTQLTNAKNTGVETGAIIWNIDAGKLQVYDGTDWQSCN